MKIKNTKLVGTTIGCVAAFLIFLAVGGISWLLTCGIIKLIAMCFGLTFSWEVATGIWLIMCLARTVFSRTIVKK